MTLIETGTYGPTRPICISGVNLAYLPFLLCEHTEVIQFINAFSMLARHNICVNPYSRVLIIRMNLLKNGIVYRESLVDVSVTDESSVMLCVNY